jgi:hypothetical protein
MHLILANDLVVSDIARVRTGEIIEISGSLAEFISTSDGWRWKSQLTLNDIGKGACELILVKSLRIVTP